MLKCQPVWQDAVVRGQQFGSRLRGFREQQFLSQAELAKRANLHELTIHRLEIGSAAPFASTVRLLADALGVSPNDLASPDETAEAKRARAAEAGN